MSNENEVEDHKCHAKGCQVVVPPEKLMCLEHWTRLPTDLKKNVLKHYRPGQCYGRAAISPEWLKAAHAAIDFIAATEGKAPAPVESDLVTILGRCVERHVELNRGELSQAGRKAANLFRVKYQREPLRTPEIINAPGDHSLKNVFGYSRSDLAIVDRAIDETLPKGHPDSPDFFQGSPAARCVCEKPYRDHPASIRWPWLIVLCNGRLVQV